MTFLLVATLLGGWGYDGFASDPSKPAPAASSSPTSAKAVLALATRPDGTTRTGDSTLAVGDASWPRSPAPVSAPAPAPVVWRLSDSSGRLWEHTDLDGLRRWVADRNAAPSYRAAWPARPMMPVYSSPPSYSPPSSSYTCTSGGCYRSR